MKTVLVLISANIEWRSALTYFGSPEPAVSPLGEWLEDEIGEWKVIYFHGGWGKIAAAASAVYAISRWQPELLFNLATCGGFPGKVQKGDVILLERTVVYDIEEQMGDAQEALAFYSSAINLDWLAGEAQPVRRGTLVSADRDIRPQDVSGLVERYGALGGDWESGSIAWVANRYALPVLILRGVTDIVYEYGSETYADFPAFERETRSVMKTLLDAFPAWLKLCANLPAKGGLGV